MSDNRRDRDRKNSRRNPFREPKPRILVVTEGEVTEPEYLKAFATAFKNQLFDVKVAGEHGHDPKSMVGIAKDYLQKSNRHAETKGDEFLRYESVWCVFDVDDHLRIPEAKVMASDNGIHLAISNPSFELWLLLHFRECPGPQHRDKILEMLKDSVPGYCKHVDFKHYISGYDDAVRRATKMDELAVEISEEGRNPTTGVYKLTRLICGSC